MNSEKFWLVRHADRSFSRPMNESELMKKFSEGEIKPLDELCCSTDYWFSVKDLTEMRKHFGEQTIEGLFKSVKEEVTSEFSSSTTKIVVPPKEMEEIRKQAEKSNLQIPATPTQAPAMSTIQEKDGFSLGKVILIALTIGIGLLIALKFG